MSDDSDPVHGRIRRLEVLLALSLFLAIVPWIVLGLGAWKFTRGELEFKQTLVVPAIELRAPDGHALVKLGPGPGPSGSLRMYNAAGKELVYLGGEPQGGGNLTLHAKTGDVIAAVRDNEGHGGGMQLLRENKLIGYVGAGTNDVGLLQLLNKDAKEYALLSTTKDGDACFGLKRSDGNESVSMGVDEHGSANIQLHSQDQKGCMWLESGAKGGRLAVFDSRGLQRAFLGPCAEGFEAFELLGDDGQDICQLADNGTGGTFSVSAYGGLTAVSAQASARFGGAGGLTLFHPNGEMIVGLGMSRNESNGIINVFDLKGEMIYREPGGLIKD